jgi:hypothetical protein
MCAPLSDYEITLKPGESKKIEITIERAPEFNASVTLDVLFLASAFANTLPASVILDDVYCGPWANAASMPAFISSGVISWTCVASDHLWP